MALGGSEIGSQAFRPPALNWQANGQPLCDLGSLGKEVRGSLVSWWGRGRKKVVMGGAVYGCKDPRDGLEEGEDTSSGCPAHLGMTAQQRVQSDIGGLCPGWHSHITPAPQPEQGGPLHSPKRTMVSLFM